MKKSRVLKLIIFDLDGTLVDAYRAITASFNYTMRSLGYPRQDPRVIRRAVGWGDASLLVPFIHPRDLKKALLIYRRHHQKALLAASRLYPKAKTVLGYLKAHGYKLAVASNRPTRFSWVLIRHLGLKRYFQYVLCADKLKHAKPHPEIMLKIMQRFKVRPKEVLYVGDMTVDAQTGRQAKVKTIIVTGGSSTQKEISKEKPYRIIRSIYSLLGQLEDKG